MSKQKRFDFPTSFTRSRVDCRCGLHVQPGKDFSLLFAGAIRRKCRLKFPYRQNRVVSNYCVVVGDFPVALYETDAGKLNVEDERLRL